MPEDMKLSMEQVKHILTEVQKKLKKMFESGIYYIDVKSDNIFIAQDEEKSEKNTPIVFIGDIESIVFKGDKENCLTHTYFYPGAFQPSKKISGEGFDEDESYDSYSFINEKNEKSSDEGSDEDELCDYYSSIYATNVEKNQDKWIQFCTSALCVDFLFNTIFKFHRKEIDEKKIKTELIQTVDQAKEYESVTFKNYIQNNLKTSAENMLKILIKPKVIVGSSSSTRYKRIHRMLTRSMFSRTKN